MSTPEGEKAGSGGNTKMQGTGASVVGSLSGSGGGGGLGATVGTGSGTGGTAYPIDLASASKVLVRPTEKTNMPTTYRIGNSAGNQMRVVIPSNAAPQTFYRQAINVKQDTTNRTQITALPARTVTQTSITVSRPQTPTTYHVPARVPTTVASIQGPRATITAPIRIPTPPISVANLNTYVRQSVPSRTSSPSATIISQGTTTWMPNVVQVPTQLIRANSITQAPRARVVAQTIPANQASGNINNATITANVVAHQASTSTNQQNVSIGGANQSQAFVATLAAAVLPPQRQLTSTLVYTNNSSQPYSTGSNPQRLTLATTLSPQRPAGARPMQRLPTSNLGVRVTAGSISIRTPSVPVLAPTTVLTTIASGTASTQGRAGAVSTANISNTIPARIIQVQNPQSGQVISGGRLPTNLVNIQPLIVSNNRFPHSNIQPSLTIAQVGKLTPVAASPVSNISNSTSNNQDTACGTTTLQTASGQQIVVSSSQVSAGALNSSGGSGSTATIITGNLISTQSSGGGQAQSQGQITQIVNVNPGSVGSALSGQTPQIVTVSQGQVISTQQAISVSNSGGTGSTTVIPIPLAITGGRNASIPVSVATLSANQNPINIVTGGGSTITGIVRTTTSGAGGISTSAMPSILPIAKVTPQQLSGLSTIDTSISSASYSVAGTGASLYIQTRPQQPSTIVTTVASAGKSSTLNVVPGNASGAIGNAGTTFLPTSTFYYERVTPSPASSSQTATTSAPGAIGLVQSVSALTSTTITTTSALSGPVFSISSSALNSATIATGSSGTVTGPIVAGLSSNQLNLSNVITTTVSSLPYAPAAGSFAIVQTSGRNISGPIHGIVSSSSAAGAAQSVQAQQQSHPQQSNQLQQQAATQIQTVPVRFHPQLLVDGGQTQQIIMTGTSASNSGQQSQSAHMLIPVNPSGKLESPQSSILRKRGLEGSPIKMGKDLTQTLIAMGKERAREIEQQREQRERERDLSPPPSRPLSTDGSTTVSATSSPGIDQQEQEEIKAMAYANRNANSDLPFKPVIEDIFHRNQHQQHQLPTEPPSSLPPQLSTAFNNSQAAQHQNSTASNSNNGNYEQSPRKKPRKQNVAEGLKSVANSLQFYANNELDSSYRMDTSGGGAPVQIGDYIVPTVQQMQQAYQQQAQHSKHKNSNNVTAVNNSSSSMVNNVVATNSSAKVDDGQSSASCGKEATAAPKDVSVVRKSRNVSLLETYKQSWKAANNHFHRYTDVKQREERRPTIVDIANQSHVLQKVNGWKIYHLSAQIEDLCELESQAYDKLDEMLKTMEATPKPSAEIERINELLKGNMQRSKIIIDGINEARTQIMKIFDHKTHVSDIIQRCASKRNFKKREKT